ANAPPVPTWGRGGMEFGCGLVPVRSGLLVDAQLGDLRVLPAGSASLVRYRLDPELGRRDRFALVRELIQEVVLPLEDGLPGVVLPHVEVRVTDGRRVEDQTRE